MGKKVFPVIKANFPVRFLVSSDLTVGSKLGQTLPTVVGFSGTFRKYCVPMPRKGQKHVVVKSLFLVSDHKYSFEGLHYLFLLVQWIMTESAIYKEFLVSKQRWHNTKRSNLFSKGCRNSELHSVEIWQSDCSFLLYYCSSSVSGLLHDGLPLFRADLWYLGWAVQQGWAHTSSGEIHLKPKADLIKVI